MVLWYGTVVPVDDLVIHMSIDHFLFVVEIENGTWNYYVSVNFADSVRAKGYCSSSKELATDSSTMAKRPVMMMDVRRGLLLLCCVGWLYEVANG